MSTTHIAALVLAVAATVAGLAIIAAMRDRSRRRRRLVRAAQHPSVRLPLSVGLVADDDRCDVRIDVLTGSPPLAIDIVSYRSADPAGAWDSVPIVDPVEILSGGHCQVATTLAADAAAADVVVAWTGHHPTGDVRASHLFRLPPARDLLVPPPAGGATIGGRTALGLTLFLVGAAAIAATLLFDSGDRVPGESGHATTWSPASPAVTTSVVASDVTTTDVHMTVVLRTIPQDMFDAFEIVDATTTAPTTPGATSPDATPSTSSTVVTSSAATTTAALAPGVRVVAQGRTGPCQFGQDCLIVGFELDGFTSSPQMYTCEFADGSRFTFSFDSDGVDTACSTGSFDDAITVEVAGVRSQTVTRADAGTD